MATTISGFCTLSSILRPKSHLPLRALGLRSNDINVSSNPSLAVVFSNKKQLRRRREIVRSVDEETLIPEEAESGETEQAQESASSATEQPESVSSATEQPESVSSATEQPVSVPVSPSDVLTMFFQAEGTMNETAIPTVTNALEAAEGISNLKIQVVEGIASVELKKQTTVQATGVASNLLEIIQGSGFKLQTLNLSFEDEDDII